MFTVLNYWLYLWGIICKNIKQRFLRHFWCKNAYFAKYSNWHAKVHT